MVSYANGYADTYADVFTAPSFPADILNRKVEILLSGVWTDISAYCYERAPFVIQRGRPNEASRAQPSTATLTLNNRDGRFSPKNPTGPYYPHLTRNTQIRISGPTDATQAALGYRFWGEVAAWPQRWDVSGKDVYVTVQANGLLRRLNQTTATVGSVMKRFITRLTGANVPFAYWPAEDGTGSTQLASGLSGGYPMYISGSASLAADSAFACSDALVQMGSATAQGHVAAYPAASVTAVRALVHIPSGGLSGTPSLLQAACVDGTTLTLSYNTGGFVFEVDYNTAAVAVYDGATSRNGELLLVSIEVSASAITLVILQAGNSTPQTYTTSRTGTPLSVGAVQINPAVASAKFTVGHIFVQAGSSVESLSNFSSALAAWAGESAGARFSRLCAEEGITGTLTGTGGTAMGQQGDKKLLDLLQEIEDADRGILHEPRGSFGLGYIGHDALYNQAAQAALDYSAAHLSPPVEPTEDDQLTRNDVTATRSAVTGNGSSAEVAVTSGPLSTQAPPNGVGVYGYQLSVNVESDSQLADVAGWTAHVGTVDEPRYPVLSVQLERSELASLFGAAQGVDIGSRVSVANPPAWLPPGTIDQLVWGLTETLSAYGWRLAWNCVPESPWEVPAASGAWARADTAGSTLAAAATSTDTSLSVATSAGPQWTTSAADFPFDIIVAGERMTVTGVAGGYPQPFTVVRSVNGVVKAQAAGAAVTLYRTPVAAL